MYSLKVLLVFDTVSVAFGLFGLNLCRFFTHILVLKTVGHLKDPNLKCLMKP